MLHIHTHVLSSIGYTRKGTRSLVFILAETITMAFNNNPFHHVANLIKKLSINDDSIVINRKIKDVTDDFNALILDDENSIR